MKTKGIKELDIIRKKQHRKKMQLEFSKNNQDRDYLAKLLQERTIKITLLNNRNDILEQIIMNIKTCAKIYDINTFKSIIENL
jgi:hypothetical protein